MRVHRRVVLSIGAVLGVVANVTVLPSAAQAKPITCGSVVTRSVVLTRDLLGCQGDGLVIGASGITVDLGGHTIAGLVSDDSVGIRNAGRPNVLIKNGVVREFERGVQLTRATANRLRGLTVELNASDGIDLDRASGNQIRLVGNSANDNDDLGIEAVAGVTDGGGNTASGNGNPVQCLNVRCT
jgi:hypothetical protein